MKKILNIFKKKEAASTCDLQYINNLLNRMDSEEKLPQSGPFESSNDTVSFQAYREAEKLSNLEILPFIKTKLNTLENEHDFMKLGFILAGLLGNVRSEKGNEIYVEICSKFCPQTGDSLKLSSLIRGAKKAKIKECYEFVKSTLNHDGINHMGDAIEYLGHVIGKNTISIIGAFLDKDCYEKCNPMYCAWALTEIGSEEAIPYLERAVSRNRKGRKGWQRDAVAYCTEAIDKLKQLE